MEWLWLIILAAIIVVIKFYPIKKQDKQKDIGETDQPKKDYSQSYQRKYLLTKNEYHEYIKLRQYATERGLLICPKVRLLDIIEPRKGEKDYKSLLFKIQAKHVDFVICDKDLRIKAILELEDNSHNQKDRQERDTFVNQILSSVGYKVIQVRAVTETTLDGVGELTKTEVNTLHS